MSFFTSRTARSVTAAIRSKESAGAVARQRPRRILVANGKGGCGKTTVATNLAGYYASKQYRTALLDYDPQGSSMHWVSVRREAGHPEIHAVAAHRTASRMTRTFQLRIPADTQRVILDAPAGVHGHQLIEMLRDVDAVVIPVLPSAIDIHAVSRFIEELLLVGHVRARAIRVGVVANRVRENSPVYQTLERFLNSLRIPFITRFREADSYVLAAQWGCSVHEIRGRRNNARDRDQWQPLIHWLEEGFRTRTPKG